MAPTYKLTYFNARGLTETARMLFVLADVEFQDYRMKREEWPSIKLNTPFGQVPLLEVDGMQISQATAIYRYLAHKFGLAGATLEENARLDMIVECIQDMSQAINKIRREPDEARKVELKKELVETTLPAQLEKLTAFVEGKQFFLGDKLTWADLVFLNSYPSYKYINVDLPFDKKKYPTLNALADRVAANPKLAAWIKKRPVTEM